MTLIVGNTYPVKDQLRALGGRWNAAKQGWEVPDDKADEANRLVSPAGGGKPKGLGFPAARKPRSCKDCGCRINYGTYCGKCEYR